MKKINTQTIATAYTILNSAKLTKMEDKDKFALIKALRKMKAIATGFDEFKKDAQEKLQGDNHKDMVEKAQQWQTDGENTTLSEEERIEINKYFADYQNKVVECVKEEAEKEQDLDIEPLSEEAFGKLMASNDWSAGEILLIEEIVGE